MYLHSRELYKSGRGTSIVSQNSSKESITNAVSILKAIVEEETFPNSLSSMASKTHTFASNPQIHSMVMNVRLPFAKINIHDAQIYKDPINHWIPLDCED